MLPVLLATLLASPNVVLISVDTLRADHLGFYGHANATSPNLDRLAARGIVFDDMVCEIPLTGPSFCSMMTSRYPRATGVTRNGIRLPDEVPTVAERFASAGYQTVCVTSNWTLKRKLSGLNRGFEVYEDAFNEKRWGILKSERDADEVAALAMDLVASRDTDRPLFAWFHFSDPHGPYKKHKGFEVAKPSDWPDDKGARTKARYDSEIAYTDSWIGALLEVLPEEDTYVVFVGDHGESLWEHDYLGHGRHVYQTGLHIPFFVVGPGVAAGRSDVQARGIDVGPTLLGLAGLDGIEGMMGHDLLDEDTPGERVRVVETYGGAVLPNLPGAKALMAGRGPQYQAVLDGKWKLIVGKDHMELFDLGRDPKELNNLAREEPATVDSLAVLVQEWSDAIAMGVSEEAGLDAEDEEALKSLGYLE